jgi:hypothetical protein
VSFIGVAKIGVHNLSSVQYVVQLIKYCDYYRLSNLASYCTSIRWDELKAKHGKSGAQKGETERRKE